MRPGIRFLSRIISGPSLAIFLFCIFSGRVHAQKQDSSLKKVKLKILVIPEEDDFSPWIQHQLKGQHDSASLAAATHRIRNKMERKGYAEFTFDSIRKEKDSLIVQVHTGPQYFLQSLTANRLPESAIRSSDFDKLSARIRPFSRPAAEEGILRVMEGFQDRGYPFAKFDSLQVEYHKSGDSLLVNAQWDFDPGDFVKIDTIQIKNKIRESPKFVYSVIGLRPGDPFNQSAIEDIRRKLENTVYFRDAKKPELVFYEKSAKLVLDFQPRKAGRFDVLLGILPPLKEEPQKLRFTGLVDLLLVSPVFSSGELLKLRYDKLVGSSQKLLLNYQHPWIAGSPISGEFELNILKQDTLFLSRYIRVSAGYQVNPFLLLKAWYRNRSSSLLSTKAYENDTTKRPPVLDGSDNMYGLAFTFDNLDYRFNPTRGFQIRLNAGAGLKKVKKNPRISENQYAGVVFSLPRQEVEAELHAYFPTFKRQVLHVANHTWWLRQTQYFQNDLAQVGGAQSIRGFNENQFFAGFYSVFTAEYRYLLERNSWLFAFGDFGYLESPNMSPFVTWPAGIGAGMAYETKAGIVSITYAVGRTGESAFQPARGRIHFGLVNQF